VVTIPTKRDTAQKLATLFLGKKKKFHQKIKAVFPFDDFSPTEND
jgi:hypothetical protein